VRRARHRRQRRILRRQRSAPRPHQRIYHKAVDGKYVLCAVLFELEPGVIGAVTLSRRSASSSARTTRKPYMRASTETKATIKRLSTNPSDPPPVL
jgi:hypothetical protein